MLENRTTEILLALVDFLIEFVQFNVQNFIFQSEGRCRREHVVSGVQHALNVPESFRYEGGAVVGKKIE